MRALSLQYSLDKDGTHELNRALNSLQSQLGGIATPSITTPTMPASNQTYSAVPQPPPAFQYQIPLQQASYLASQLLQQQQQQQQPQQQLQQPSSFTQSQLGSKENPVYTTTARSQVEKVISIIQFIILLLFAAYLFNTVKIGISRGGAPGNSLFSAVYGQQNFQVVENTNKTFSDVKGIDPFLDELKLIVHFLKNPETYREMGAELPKGVLLVGPPGTGKTLLAKAIAGEAGVPFYYASASQFEEVFVGLGAGRIRELFKQAQANSPCIIFLDEIDALGKRSGQFQNNTRQSLNELLTQMDGFHPSSGIIVIGATNQAEMMDSALKRPGRFDKIITVAPPDEDGRLEILKYYFENKKVNKSVDVRVLAKRTTGFTGADISNLVNESAINAVVDKDTEIRWKHVERAFDRIVLGVERKSKRTLFEDQERTAIHEAGHSILTLVTGSVSKLHKVTINPRGLALGVTHTMPRDSSHMTKKQLIDMIDVALGGILAEEIIYGKDNVATGASSDLRHATQVARAMVERYGMSELGLVDYTIERNDAVGSLTISPETSRDIDTQITKLLEQRSEHVKNVLEAHKDDLLKLAGRLVEKEELRGQEVDDLLRWSIRFPKPNPEKSKLGKYAPAKMKSGN